jgi:GNAT superfamily N-acetyltransferase
VTGIVVRPARRGEAGLIHGFIRELAAYEKLLDAAVATVENIDAALFGENPRVFCDIAEMDGAPIGFALWFYNFSTFQGRCGLYLEDLYVRPEARGLGAGKALLARLAKRCVEEGLGRMDWAVLDWNAPSIAFYDSLGALALNDWITRRLTGGALTRLASLN